MSYHGSTEGIANKSPSENVGGEMPEFRTLIQETINEQFRRLIVPLTRWMEELVRLV